MTQTYVTTSLGSGAKAWQLTWFAFMLAGQAGLIALLLTLCISKTITPRLPVVYNLLLVLILEASVHLILLFTGKWMDVQLDQATCLAQAALKRGLDSAFIISAFAFVFESWRCAVKGNIKGKNTTLRTFFFLSFSFLTFLLYLLITVMDGIRSPQHLFRNPDAFFCIYYDGTL
ncbi:hypothetical protein SISSUDRAFT_629709 [Sistotremastrum suecicum HHB10207 ss-3]|uniref:G-protein coupled receptors family 1 profile domain-containing protein n=1 Tax=Sistotremastrum suecicum HHB10207 ss-3 TaxID=1314776 RepID=A0A166EGV0_9AGAM|nr:hypothetical protein SISSUDRAFT_629709 [Sistotremastrum suecicum HHB10207 ss-3]